MMECNECGKETDSIMVICPECDGKKDEQIELLKAQIADREAELAEAKNLIARARIWVWEFICPNFNSDEAQELRDLDKDLIAFVPDHQERLIALAEKGEI